MYALRDDGRLVARSSTLAGAHRRSRTRAALGSSVNRAGRMFHLRRVDKSPGRAGMYHYGPASIWVSGPSGGTWWATIKFLHQEKDVDAKSFDALMDVATGWVDRAPELRSANLNMAGAVDPASLKSERSAKILMSKLERRYDAAHHEMMAVAERGRQGGWNEEMFAEERAKRAKKDAIVDEMRALSDAAHKRGWYVKGPTLRYLGSTHAALVAANID